MDAVLQIALYLAKLSPSVGIMVGVILLGALVRQVAALGSNHIAHLQASQEATTEAVKELRPLLQTMNDNVIYVKAVVAHDYPRLARPSRGPADPDLQG